MTGGLCAALAVLTSSGSLAGLIQVERAPLEDAYSAITIRDLREPGLQRYWHDQIDYVDLKSPVGATIYDRSAQTVDGRRIRIQMLIAMPACGIRECPIRVYSDQDDLLIDTMGCTETSMHAVSTKDNEISICGNSYKIPQPSSPSGARMAKPMWHNGSLMEVSFLRNGDVTISYRRPRPSLPPQFAGQIVFSGRLARDGRLSGVAYTFKTGCLPAPYTVEGSVFRRSHIVLRGASPVRDRRNCAVVGMTSESPNSQLEFVEAALESIDR